MTPQEYEEIASTLVGRRIVETITGPSRRLWGQEADTVEYTLDDGRVLRAVQAFGCACENGNWSVEAPQPVGDEVITSVAAVEDLDEWSEHGNGSATLRLFVYQEGIPAGTEIVRSEGADNGYYGWGYELEVVA